jgi:hypothetical protein
MMEMQIAQYWAHVFGPFLSIIGLWMLLYKDNFLKIAASIKASPASFYILGVFQLFIGLILVTQCNIWVINKVILVTILGWFLLLRGIVSLFVPQLLLKLLPKGKKVQWIGLLPLVWGILLYWAILS